MRVKSWTMLSAAAAMAMIGCRQAEEGAAEMKLDTDEARVSYSIGYSVGKNIESTLSQSGDSADVETLVAGLRAALSGSTAAIAENDMQRLLQQKGQERQASMKEEQIRQSRENLEAGRAYQKENAGKDGVVVLPSGLQYRVIEEGDGAKPALEDTVVAHYEGTFVDGEVFDSSRQRGEPASFPLNRVIKGWQEVLQLMPVGSRWEVVIPPELGYGARTGQGMPPNSTLVFDIELLDIKEAGG